MLVKGFEIVSPRAAANGAIKIVELLDQRISSTQQQPQRATHYPRKLV